jgi:serine/threonine protein kinase
MLHNKVDDNRFIIKFYGITQDPETKNYMMVLDYAKEGSLRNYLDKNYNELNWKMKVNYLYYIAFAIESIHKMN